MELILFQQGDGKEALDKNGETILVLSKKGSRTVRAAARVLSYFIPRKVKVQVWSSVAPVASNTAALVAQELGVKHKILKALETKDIDSILQAALEYGAENCIVLISSQECLQEWIKVLTAVEIPFAEASAAGLTVEPDNLKVAKMQWFVNGKYLKAIR